MRKIKVLIPLLGLTRHGGSVVIYDIISHCHENFSFTILTINVEDTTIKLPSSVNIINLNYKNRSFYNIIRFLIYVLIYRFKFKNILLTHFLIFIPFFISLKFNLLFLSQGEEYKVFKNKLLKLILKIIYIIAIKLNNSVTTSHHISVKYKIRYINLGIDSKFLNIRNIVGKDKKYDIIYFGRLEKYKRFDLFYKIYKNTNFKCLIVTNNINLLNYYNSLNFDYTYIRTTEELINCIDNSKLSVLTSDYEGLGLTPLECMSRGVVPIIRDCGGPSAYAVNNYNAIIISNNATKQDYIIATKKLIEDIGYREIISNNAFFTGKNYNRDYFLNSFKNELLKSYKHD